MQYTTESAAQASVSSTDRLSQAWVVISVLKSSLTWLFVLMISAPLPPLISLPVYLLLLGSIVADVAARRGKPFQYRIAPILRRFSPLKDLDRFMTYRAKIDGNELIRKLGIVQTSDETQYAAELRHFEGDTVHVLRLSVPHAKLTAEVLDKMATDAEPYMRSSCHEIKEPVPGEFSVVWRRHEPENPLAEGRLFSVLKLGTVGRDIEGRDVRIDILNEPWHVLVQGQTRSGKSAALYGILARLSQDFDSGRIVFGGIDPSGLLLSPFDDYPAPELRAVGPFDDDSMAKIAAAIAAAIEYMDSRISQMRLDGVDKVEPSMQAPGLVFVLEEYPGLLARVDTWDKAQKPADRLGPVLRSGVQRLIQEGAKAGIRVIIIAQRADASFIGGSERSNIGTRISLRVDNADAVRMVFPELASDPTTVGEISKYIAGQALLGMPAEDPKVIRFDLLGYQSYTSIVRSQLKSWS